ncbi:isoaspartyl peptidase/L-asparaginase-like [Diadema antillarum]|uniref:isoaspartyl peptidase/L-asparaginase-like n=1 Tax=Diadema antillarum TaxID=105358 RepID=UPI003A83DD7C
MSSTGTHEPAIIVHGGALTTPDGGCERYHSGVQEAAREGYKVLMGGGTAVDAVERAVCVLEDNPLFNAGCGSKLNAAGEIEMDAIIMDGNSLKSGALAGVRDVKNPIKLARCIMEKTEHDFLIGKGLESFIDEHKISRVDPSSLMTKEKKEHLQEILDTAYLSEILQEKRHTDLLGTVGAVAMDKSGSIAAATSTGGITGKRVGRVGDSPLIGSGAYCDSAVGGVSTTGIGEAIMRAVMAGRIVLYMEQGLSCREAAQKALEYQKRRTSFGCGVIVLGADGQTAPVFSSEGLIWAQIQKGSLSYGISQGECFDGGSV